jgi:general secretion pathway protein A
VVLVIDEAQNLQPEVLEQIRMLSNLETETDKLIQIILVGQPELGAILERAELRQLSQRITVRYHLRPMDFDDAGAYIRHRLDVAGCRDDELFSPRAIRKIYRFAKGFPRLINILCDRALLVGYTEDSRGISSAMVDTAISELQRQTRGTSIRLRLWPAFAAVAACLAVMGGALYWWHYQAKAAPLAAVVHADEAQGGKTVALLPSKVPSSEGLSTLRRNLAAVDQSASATAAFNGLAALWGAEPLPDGQQISDAAEFVEALNQRNLSVTPYRGSLDSLISLNSPALLELTLPGVVGYRYLSLISVSGERVTVSPPASGRSDLPLSELQGLWSGNAYLPWTNHLNLPNFSDHGETREEVLQLQDLLKNAGVYTDAPTGRYDSATISAVTRFQASRGIVQDGRVGPQTLMLLYQVAGKFDQPKLKRVRQGEGS